ncbi:MAG: efflux RND transporter permease subunit [Alphaproteobacteria bacterium]|nr:efflux RND transporter permease subunit [Alphaproteobacteria bacterium]
MNLAGIAIEKRAVTYFAVFLLFAAGIGAFFNLGQLEDPEFTVKTAVVVTPYPGASPKEVELEVTDRIELALMEMAEIDYLESFSRAGMSLVEINIKEEFWSDRLPQVWDEMRRKMNDVEPELPPGAGPPLISDDFGDVFGFQLALTGDGYTYAELETFAKNLRKELNIVEGVARVDLWGVRDQIVYLDVMQSQLSQLKISEERIAATIGNQNVVVDAGGVDVQNRRARIAPSGEFQSPEDIANLQIRAMPVFESEVGDTGQEIFIPTKSPELVRIRDIGTIRQGYLDPPNTMMRFNGQPALGISITNVSGINVVTMGRRVEARVKELEADLPIGVELHKVHWQSDIVDESVSGFLVSFGQAVAIVLVVLTLAMGWRMGLVIGFALITTILASFILMLVFGIDLQRMSLGALVIALGMMVDNAIVVSDGYVVRVQNGMDPKDAAIEAANQPAWPLLGATVIAVMAFYPIFASTADAGEYCRTLFSVVGIALLTSWVIASTVTPLQCLDMLKNVKGGGGDQYGGKFYQIFRGILGRAIRGRWVTLGALVALLVAAVMGFGNVRQEFFPDSSMRKFMIDFWAVDRTRIQTVAEDLRRAEQHLLEDDRIEAVTAYIGSGPPRFYLPVDPEYPHQHFAQFIVNVRDQRDIDGLMNELHPWFKETFVDALTVIQKYGVGPSNTWRFEARISGPAVADPDTLRALADQGLQIMEQSPLAAYARTNWGFRVKTVVPAFNDERGRWTSVTRTDLANTTKRAYDGRTIGLYRQQDDLIPIVLRHVEEERENVGAMDVLQITPSLSTKSVPVAAVVDGINSLWEDPLIWRYDRRRTITIQGNPIFGVTLPTLRESVLKDFNAIELPPGYRLEWGGEFEDTVDAQASLIPGMIPAGVVIVFIIVALFNAFRPPLVILCTVPFAVIGITAGLLATNQPFGFLALLGAMSLAGMMIKNAIVLLDEVNLNLAGGKKPYDAVVEAAVSRLRPVVLAAATTVLGVIPLLPDVFWVAMAITIMAGLTFGTVLTMVLIPVLYATFFKIPAPAKA